MSVLKIIWERWRVIAHKIGDFQARLLLSLFYFVVLGPFALGRRLGSDPLGLRPGAGGGWLTRSSVEGEPLALARRQF